MFLIHIIVIYIIDYKLILMSLAVYQGCPHCHYEMLGYVIEYIKYTKISNVVIYVEDNITSNGWRLWYESVFNIKIGWTNPRLYNPDNHIKTIVLTEDDPTFKEEWIQNYPEKIIMIAHNTKAYKKDTFARIHTRFLAKRPNALWALPCYFSITKEQKKDILKNLNVINVVCVGVQNTPPSIEFLKDLIGNFDNSDIPIHFHIIARYFIKKYDSYPSNVHLYENCSTETMTTILKNAHYVLCCEFEGNQYPIYDSMSGAIPIAFSFCCKLIIPNIWQLFYGFSSAIGYNDEILQKNGKTTINLSSEIDIDNIYNETYSLISHRNKIFDLTLKSNLIRGKIENHWKLEVLQMLSYTRIPNVYFNINKKISDDEFLLIKRDFREIHFIGNGKSENYVYNHENIEYIKNINTTIFFEVDNVNLKEYWNILNDRQYLDIILIYNISIDNLRNFYKKHCMIYNLNNFGVLVLNQR